MKKQDIEEESEFDMLHIRVSRKIKNEAKFNLEVIGVTLAHAIKIYLSQIVLQGGIPYKGFINTSKRVTTAHDMNVLYNKARSGLDDLHLKRIVEQYEKTGKLNVKKFLEGII